MNDDWLLILNKVRKFFIYFFLKLKIKIELYFINFIITTPLQPFEFEAGLSTTKLGIQNETESCCLILLNW